jgi:hypothetical protein
MRITTIVGGSPSDLGDGFASMRKIRTKGMKRNDRRA